MEAAGAAADFHSNQGIGILPGLTMLKFLSSLLNKYPVAGPIVSAGLLSIVGDGIAQHGIERRGWRNHDFRRTARLTFYGFAIIGPASCFWLRYLDKNFMHPHAGIRTLQRVAADQLLFSPVFLAVFFIFNHLAEKGRVAGVSTPFKSAYWETLMANYKLWPMVQCVNFYLIPLNFQLMFLNVIAIGWTAFLSNMNARTSLTHLHKD